MVCFGMRNDVGGWSWVGLSMKMEPFVLSETVIEFVNGLYMHMNSEILLTMLYSRRLRMFSVSGTPFLRWVSLNLKFWRKVLGLLSREENWCSDLGLGRFVDEYETFYFSEIVLELLNEIWLYTNGDIYVNMKGTNNGIWL